MANALTVPHAVAALVLLVAGMAKLRSPRPAARAVAVSPLSVRVFATFELALGVWALMTPDQLGSALMAALYAGFSVTTFWLSRIGTACGCFGEEVDPASPVQSVVSGVLFAVCLICAIAAPHGAAWILGRSAGEAAVLFLGIAGAVYGTVLAYSELPLLWRSWSPA